MGFPIETAPAYSRDDHRRRAPRSADEPARGTAVARWIAVAGGFGYCPIAPGTAGSLAGVLLFLAPLAWAARTGASESGWPPGIGWGGGGFALGLAVLAAAGSWAAGRAERVFGRADDGRIVIDEVVGQLIALAPLVYGAGGGLSAEAGPGRFFCAVVTGFVSFRLFDVWKPGPIRWAERRFSGGIGVMADDVVAGLFAALGLIAVGAGLGALA